MLIHHRPLTLNLNGAESLYDDDDNINITELDLTLYLPEFSNTENP